MIGSLTAETTRRLINDLGQEFTLRKKAHSDYDPTNPTLTTTDTDYTVRGYAANYKLSEMDGNSVVTGDRKIYLHNQDVFCNTLPEPNTGDEIVGLGDITVIVGTQKLYYQDVVVCYICQVRE